MADKTRVLILFGGVSSEHEISLRSARSVLDAIDRERYEPLLCGIHRDGSWRTGPLDRPLADIVAAGEPVAGAEVLATRWLDPSELRARLTAPYHDSFRRWLEVGGTVFHSVWAD